MLSLKPLQTPDEVGANPVAISQEVALEIVRGLNQDLSSLYALYHQTKKHHWIVNGAERQEIHLLLDEHAKEQLVAADQIAERIVDLGGIPISTMAAQEARAYVEIEAEGAFPLREMLENDLSMHIRIIVKLREHINLARNYGDYATEYLLKQTLYGLEKQTNDLSDHLTAETLVTR